jgi:transposase InsO family protein
MAKRKASEPLERFPKKINTSTDFVYYQPATHPKVKKVAATKIGKRPIYKFFVDYDGKYFPLRCMLDNGSTSFVISPEAAKAFAIPVVKRTRPIRTGDASGNNMKTENLFTVPLGISFGNHRSFNHEDHAFEVMKTSGAYDALIPAWYLEKHSARGTTTSHLHFPHCPQECYNHGKIHPEYSITYDKRIALNEKAIHIGAIVQSSPTILSKLPTHYHKFLLLFDPEQAEKLPDSKGCDHRIELLGPDDKLRMGPIYQLSVEEEKILVKYLDTMIREGKIRPSSSTVGSAILFIPKPNGRGLRLCIDYRHLNDFTKKDRTPLPIMEELSARVKGATHITKVDLKSGFYLIRMALGHEKYTAFRTKFGLYEYLVMPFGLCNAPATFQREINRILRPLLGMELVIKTDIHIDEDEGMVVVAYVDDILIATKGSLEKHHKQVSKVFQLLMDNQLCIEIDKCVFDAERMPFLGFIVSGVGLEMDPEKAKAIVDWPRPTSRKEVQQLLGLWNFYRRFIQNFSGIISPISDLLRQDFKFEWVDTQEAAFLKITILFASGKTPILRHYDPDRPALLETDASDFAIAGILSQKFEDGKIHPVRFTSRKLSPAEMNYDVYDKEMLAVVFSLNKNRHYLQGAVHKTTIYSDHQNLTYFKSAVLLNRRQTRWAEELKQYNFVLLYRKGTSNAKADILSRCPAFTSREGGTTSATNQEMLDKEQWLEVGAMELENANVDSISIAALDIEQLLPEAKERIKEKALLDKQYRKLCKQVVSEGNIDKNFTIKDDILCWKNRIYVPEGLRQAVMRSEHDSKIAGHFGRERTMELLSRNFYWVNMERDIRKYCSECDNCQRTKAPRHAKHGLLHPLELACKPWTHISTDFITDLPESEGATIILVVVDRFTKMAHFIPLKKKDSPTVARAYLENVWKYHGFPEDVVSDRDTTFMGSFFTDLYNYLGIKRSMSTAYHPQTDGQTERINQVIESYLRSYCNYEQNDWASMLAMAEYAYNNSKHSTTKISPFYANYGFEPRTNWPTEIQFRNLASELYGHYMNTVHSNLSKWLEESIESMRRNYNKKRKDIEPIKKGELVMLNGKNIRAKHRCRKLEDKMLGPFEVSSVGSNLRYCKLKLPESWKIHPVFNIELLERYKGTNPKKPIIEVEADGEDWVMESIIASGPSDGNAKQHVFLVKWKDYSHEENTWETYENVADNDLRLLEEYYKNNPKVERDGRFLGKIKKRYTNGNKKKRKVIGS